MVGTSAIYSFFVLLFNHPVSVVAPPPPGAPVERFGKIGETWIEERQILN